MRTLHQLRRHAFVHTLCALVYANSVMSLQAQKIDKEHPSVYITFAEFVKNVDGIECPSGCAKLILHNNTKWPIYYTTAYDPTVEGAAITYVIELKDGSRDIRNRTDQVMSNNRLMPGKTLRFVVPKTDFAEGSKIYIDFSFAWELVSAEKNSGDQTIHRAYFRASDLPAWP